MRTLRRVPEVALTVLAAFARGSTLDLSAHAPELLAVLVLQLRSKASGERAVGGGRGGAAVGRGERGSRVWTEWRYPQISGFVNSIRARG